MAGQRSRQTPNCADPPNIVARPLLVIVPHVNEKPDQLDNGSEPYSPAGWAFSLLFHLSLLSSVELRLNIGSRHRAESGGAVSVVLTNPQSYLWVMGKSNRDVREMQASMACELAHVALSLTAEPGLEHAEALKRIKTLVEILEVTTTALLTSNGISWEQIGSQLDGVTRQSFHRRLSRKVVALMDADPGVMPLSTGPGVDGARVVVRRLHWVKQLERIEAELRAVAEVGNHPAIVKHWRRAQSRNT
jgi:hypothetical protein